MDLFDSQPSDRRYPFVTWRVKWLGLTYDGLMRAEKTRLQAEAKERFKKLKDRKRYVETRLGAYGYEENWGDFGPELNKFDDPRFIDAVQDGRLPEALIATATRLAAQKAWASNKCHEDDFLQESLWAVMKRLDVHKKNQPIVRIPKLLKKLDDATTDANREKIRKQIEKTLKTKFQFDYSNAKMPELATTYGVVQVGAQFYDIDEINQDIEFESQLGPQEIHTVKWAYAVMKNAIRTFIRQWNILLKIDPPANAEEREHREGMQRRDWFSENNQREPKLFPTYARMENLELSTALKKERALPDYEGVPDQILTRDARAIFEQREADADGESKKDWHFGAGEFDPEQAHPDTLAVISQLIEYLKGNDNMLIVLKWKLQGSYQEEIIRETGISASKVRTCWEKLENLDYDKFMAWREEREEARQRLLSKTA